MKVGYLKVAVDLYVPNLLQCYTCFKFGHHESRCNSGADNKLCRRCSEPICMHTSPCAEDCQKKLKCVSCGGEHMATSMSWQREKEIVSVKYRQGLSFQDARKIVNSWIVLWGSYAMAVKGKQRKTTELKDAQTQTDIAVQTETRKPPPKANSYKSSGKPVQTPASSPKSPIKNNNKTNKPTEKVISDSLQQHNRFQCLDEDMEAESVPAESTNKQGRIIKLNKK